MTSHSFHDLHPCSALLCRIAAFVPTVGSAASSTHLALFLRGSLSLSKVSSLTVGEDVQGSHALLEKEA